MCNTIATYIIIKGLLGIVTGFFTMAFMGTMSIVCFWSEFLSSSNKLVGSAVYDSDWLGTLSNRREDLSMVICTINRPVAVTAGCFGKVERREFMTLCKTWYRFVQVFNEP